MTITHLSYSAADPSHGEQLRVMLSMLEQGLDRLNELVGNMTTMVGPGDGSADADYTYMKTQFGFANDATAHQAFNELLSVQGKLMTDASVSSVHAALIQAFNKFR